MVIFTSSCIMTIQKQLPTRRSRDFVINWIPLHSNATDRLLIASQIDKKNLDTSEKNDFNF